ncbi:hypothetical protein IWW41_001074 [Coemansia sp. RSA 2522]|nr:hypothetical protein GGH16_000748 [Coemansia sp. RSA 560]KAJ2435119.1 hypothetical protein IWW41_001074 [Coemansia sp. RSA 2522]
MHNTAIFDVQAHGNTVLTVDVHKAFARIDEESTLHPWHELLDQTHTEHASNGKQIQTQPTDDITSQGLLDGLEDLYDFTEDHKTVHNAAPSNGDAAVDEMSDMDADAMLDQLGDFESERRSSEQVEKLHVKGKASGIEDALADMSDNEAKRIVGSLGGFSRPSEVTVGSQTPISKTPSTKTPSSKTLESKTPGGSGAVLDGLEDMDDAEAQKIIRSYGGFAKPAPGPKQQSPTVDTRPATTTQAHVPATPKSSTMFPSKNDVLSARRALKIDGGKIASPMFNSPRRTPNVRPASGLHSPSPSQRAGQTESPRRQLAFKLPNLKRVSAVQRFNSPTKRLALGSTMRNGSETSTESGDRPAVRLVQFAQPFRSPAKTGLGHRPLPQSRPPPVLPPVTTRAAAPRSAPKSVPNAEAGLRQRLGTVSAQINAGNVQDVPVDAVGMTSERAESYKFSTAAGQWGADEARQALILRGCEANVVTAEWVRNHFRWIVWGCASYARRLPTRWREFWGADHVLERLQRRYEREHVRGERPALRRVLEGDAASQQLMVLCVAVAQVSDEADNAGTARVHVEVTDGWYGVQASVDSVLEAAICSGRLRVGDKIACAGLRLDGLSEASEPLDASVQDARLIMTANSVRRAPWDATLGFQRNRTLFMSLSAVHEKGGGIGATLDVVVARRYPTLYMETLSDGHRIMRSAKEEERVLLAYAERRAERMQVELEQRGLGSDSETRMNGAKSETELVAEAELKVETEHPARQVSAMFRMRVCDYPDHPTRHTLSSRNALVTVWRASGFEHDEPREGTRLQVAGASVSRFGSSMQSGNELRLSVGGSARLRPVPADPQIVERSAYCARCVLSVDDLRNASIGCEVDVVGIASGHKRGEGGQRSVLRLCGDQLLAEVEYSSCVFGNIGPADGTRVTVRNCRLVQTPDPTTQTLYLFADDVAEFVFK